MSEEDCFWRALLDFNEKVSRLTFIDWLNDRDDPRSEGLQIFLTLGLEASVSYDSFRMQKNYYVWRYENYRDRNYESVFFQKEMHKTSNGGVFKAMIPAVWFDVVRDSDTSTPMLTFTSQTEYERKMVEGWKIMSEDDRQIVRNLLEDRK